MRASEPSRKVRLHSATPCEVNFLQTIDRLALHQSRVLLGGAQGWQLHRAQRQSVAWGLSQPLLSYSAVSAASGFWRARSHIPGSNEANRRSFFNGDVRYRSLISNWPDRTRPPISYGKNGPAGLHSPGIVPHFPSSPFGSHVAK